MTTLFGTTEYNFSYSNANSYSWDSSSYLCKES